MNPSARLILLDTSILIHYARNDATAKMVEEQYALSSRWERPLLSSIVEGEIRAFALQRDWGKQRMEPTREKCSLRLVRVQRWRARDRRCVLSPVRAGPTVRTIHLGSCERPMDRATAIATDAEIFTCGRWTFDWLHPVHVHRESHRRVPVASLLSLTPSRTQFRHAQRQGLRGLQHLAPLDLLRAWNAPRGCRRAVDDRGQAGPAGRTTPRRNSRSNRRSPREAAGERRLVHWSPAGARGQWHTSLCAGAGRSARSVAEPRVGAALDRRGQLPLDLRQAAVREEADPASTVHSSGTIDGQRRRGSSQADLDRVLVALEQRLVAAGGDQLLLVFEQAAAGPPWPSRWR